MKKKKLLPLILSLLIIVYIIYSAFFNQKQSYNKTFFYLGTVINVTLYQDQEEVFDAIEDLIKKYDTMFDRNNPNSDVYKINHGDFQVSDETLHLIEDAINYSHLTDGYFDITINPIVDLWGIGTENPRRPSDQDILDALSLVGYQSIDLSSGTLNGRSLDLGGIAKGFITDQIKEILSSYHIDQALINLGGNVYAYGDSIVGGHWNVGIRNPYPNQNEAILKVMVSDTSVVTSGIYERYFEVNDQVYHHIFNPFTGYPTDNNLVSLTVLSEHSIDGDALSTGLFALGLEKAFKLANELELEIIAITNSHKIYLSKTLEKSFENFDDDYEIIFID